MIKKIMYLIVWSCVLYGVYYLFNLYPLESVIAAGIIAISIIVYWLMVVEKEN